MQPTLIELMSNIALLLVMPVIYQLTNLINIRYAKFKQIINGLLIALLCIAIMSMPSNLYPGLALDTGSVLISVTALVFGPVPAIITLSAAIVLRILQGGAGALPGIAVIISSAVIGSVWRLWIHSAATKLRWLNVYVMSLLVHAAMIACMNLLPYPAGINLIREISLPVLLIYPLATVLLYILLTQQQAFLRVWDQLKQSETDTDLELSEKKYRQLYETMALGVVYQAADGRILSANPAAEKILGLTLDQMMGMTSLDPGWRTIREDGTELSGFDHPSMIALRTGKPCGPVIIGVYQPMLKDHVWISVNAIPLFENGEDTPSKVYTTFQDITKERKANQEYQLLFNQMVDAFALHEIICDGQGTPIDYKFLAVNPAFEKMTGLKAADIIGKNVLEILPNTESFWIETYGKVALTGESVSFKNYSAATDKYFRVVAYQPAPMQFACTFLDDTIRVRAQQALEESEKKYSSYIENAPYAVCVVDEKGQYIEVNTAASIITGYSREELLKMTIKDITAQEYMNKAMGCFTSMLDTGNMSAELKYIHKDGSVRWWAVDAVKISENRFLGFAIDTTSKKQAEEELKYQSTHDYLTGLYNRRHYETELKRLDTESQLPLSVISGDINGLKLINDAFGHAEGDKLIIECAKIIESCCRPDYILARTGGDEFGIIMPKTDSITALEALQNIQTALKKYDSENHMDMYQHSVSLGSATKEKIEEEIGYILKTAEDHMYQRKLLEANSVHSTIVASIKATMFEKSHETEEHAERLVELSKAIGMALNLSQVDLDKLELLATLHDIGKVGIRDNILTKPGKLNESEWAEMKRHPEIGYRIAMTSPELVPVAEGILCHQEWWNGNGYPKGLCGENIPLLSRIIAVVDAYDAMTNDRPYRKAMEPAEAIEIIRKNAGTQFDPKIAEIFADLMSKRRITSLSM